MWGVIIFILPRWEVSLFEKSIFRRSKGDINFSEEVVIEIFTIQDVQKCFIKNIIKFFNFDTWMDYNSSWFWQFSRHSCVNHRPPLHIGLLVSQIIMVSRKNKLICLKNSWSVLIIQSLWNLSGSIIVSTGITDKVQFKSISWMVETSIGQKLLELNVYLACFGAVRQVRKPMTITFISICRNLKKIKVIWITVT